MNSGSAATRESVKELWQPVLRAAGGQGIELGQTILDVAHQIAPNKSLLNALTDPGRTAEDKAKLAADVFHSADPRIVEMLQAMFRGRWSKPVDVVSALHDFGIEAVLEGANSTGALEEVSQELFQVREIILSNRELRMALEPSKTTSTESRVALAQRVFGDAVSDSTMSLLTWCVRHHADGGVPHNLRRVSELAAGLQQRTIADVVTAIPMTQAQQERLRSLLEQRAGTEVEMNLDIDPEVVGGVRVTMRNSVIDSTMRKRLQDVRMQLAG